MCFVGVQSITLIIEYFKEMTNKAKSEVKVNINICGWYLVKRFMSAAYWGFFLGRQKLLGIDDCASILIRVYVVYPRR